MPNLTIVGAQWGDEGKGKVVDYLARTAAVVARFQGGPNAGHTVCVERNTFTFHQIPSAILNPKATCIIGCGCVIDPYVFEHELAVLRKKKISPGQRLVVDCRAHMILPYHQQLDRLRDEQSATQRIGTTGRGIGPAYADKVNRTGIRAGDLLTEEVFNDKLKHNVAAANFLDLAKTESGRFELNMGKARLRTIAMVAMPNQSPWASSASCIGARSSETASMPTISAPGTRLT